MNEQLLNQHIDEYLKRIESGDLEEGFEERKEREEYYQSFDYEKIVQMSHEDFSKYINKMWAMSMWSNTKWGVDKSISDNGFDKLKKGIADLLYGGDNIEVRWDTFRKEIKGLGPATMSELLCYVRPHEYMLWNRVAMIAYQYLEVPDVPTHDYQLTGKKYVELTNIAKKIREIISSKINKDVDFLFVDYFFWDQLRDYKKVVNSSKEKVIDTVANNKSFHDEIVDYVKKIGSLLGYDTDNDGKVNDSGKYADALWEFNVGNIGKIKYVFEVQDGGSIDSLIVSLGSATKDISVHAVVAISDKVQIEKIKKHSNGFESNGGFNGKLKFWDIDEVEKAYTELSSAMEIINRAINARIEK